MPYIIQDDLLADIPEVSLTEALDDDSDGIADAGAWDDVYNAVEIDLHALIKSVGKSVPVLSDNLLFDSVVSAARYGCLSKLYTRRGMSGDKNPFSKQSAAALAALKALLGLNQETGSATPSPSFTSNRRKFTQRTEDGV